MGNRVLKNCLSIFCLFSNPVFVIQSSFYLPISCLSFICLSLHMFVSPWVNLLRGLVLSKQSRLASCNTYNTFQRKKNLSNYLYFCFVFPVLVYQSPCFCQYYLDWHYACLSRVCLSIPFFFVKTISTGVMFVFPVFVSQSLSFLSKQSRLVSYFYKTSLFARRNML